MKLLLGLMAFLALGVMFSRMAVSRLGVSQEYATMILYAIVALWLLGMLIAGARWLLARRAAARRDAAPVDPGIAVLRERMLAIRAGLKQLTRHQRRTAPRRPALVTAGAPMPWLVMLGLPGHGKTALLGPIDSKRLIEVDSEGPLKRSSEVAHADRPRLFCSVPGTRGGSDPGVAAYLEVPHELGRGPELRPTWLATLKLLRGQPPLQGVVLAVSLEDLLLDAQPTQRAAQIGEELAQQLTDLIATLQVHVPVYLVLTKLDRLAGFRDLLGSVSNRRQVLGFELPDGRSDELVLKELTARFDAMCEGLERLALRTISRHNDVDAAVVPRLLGFTRQLAEQADPLAALTKQLLAARGGDPLRLRGVYFTSALQSDEPALAPALTTLAHEVGGGSYVAEEPRPPANTRYFVDDLVGGAWLRSSVLATRSQRARRRDTIAAWSLAGFGAAVAAWMALGATRTTQANRALAQDTADLSGSLQGQLGGDRRAPLSSTELDRLRASLGSWEDDEGSDVAGVRAWGLFPGELVVPPLRGFFKRAVFEGVLASLHRKAEAQLHDFQARFESPDAIPGLRERTEGHDDLRFYLLLTGPKADGEYLPIAQESLFLTREIPVRWSGNARAAVSSNDYAAMGAVTKRFLSLAQDVEFTLPRDSTLVDGVREILRRDTSEDAAVATIIDRVSSSEDLPRISLRAIAGVPSLENDNSDVRGAFTAAGWQRVKAEFQNVDNGGEWVLGLDRSRAIELRRKRGRTMRDIYFTKYVQEWSRFITRMRIVSPTNLEQGKQIFGEMTRGPVMPLRKAFQRLQENVILADDFDYGEGLQLSLTSKKTVAVGAMRAGDIARQFAPILAFTVPPAGKEADVPLDNYHVHLREVRDAIGKALESSEEEKALIERLKGAIEDTRSMVRDGNLDIWSKDTEELLITPLSELLKLVERTGNQTASDDWCARIVDPMYERFSGRYPFSAEARDDVVLADFEEFFHPETGVIRKARESLLSGYVTLEGNYLVAREVGKADVARIDPAVIRFLNRAQDIGMVMFVNEELRVDFDVILVCNPQVSRVEWKVAGENRVFECNDKQPPRMRWPGKEGQGASLTAFGQRGRKVVEETSEWGLFELLERASTVPVFNGEEVLEFKFDLAAFNLGALEVRIKPTRVRGGTAFFGLPSGDRSYLGLLRAPDVIPPKRLFSNRGGCRP